MEKKVYKQGVELELSVVDLSNPLDRSYGLHSAVCDEIKEIYSGVYWDDSKPEFPSKPYESLGSLEDHVREMISQFQDVAEEHGGSLSFLGNFPFYRDFCSGHIHTSLRNMREDTWFYMKQVLYNVQPLLAYASGNSPILEGQYRASDVRLLFSNWAEFTEFNDKDPDHYLALACGNGGSTLECRIPSSAPLAQIIGIAAMIRAILENEDAPIPMNNVKESFYNVILYGARALLIVPVPEKASYYGIKFRKAFVPVSSFFKDFVATYYDYLKEQLSDCSVALQKEVFKFYDMLSNGTSMSDIILSIYYGSKTPLELAERITKLTCEYGYLKLELFNSLKEPPKYNRLPKAVREITLDELKEIVESLSFDEIEPSPIRDMVDYLLTHSRSHIATVLSYLRDGVVPSRYRDELLELGVIDEDGNVTDLASYFIQVAEEIADEY